MSETAPAAEPAAPTGAEALRRAHLKHEAAVKSVGALYYLGATISILAAVIAPMPAAQREGSLTAGLIFAALAVIYIVVGWGVRRLKPWSRAAACVVAVPGLLGVPIGTIVSVYILYLMLSQKGRMVYSPEYQAAIAATPQIKYRSTIIIWFILILIVLAIVALGLPAVVGR